MQIMLRKSNEGHINLFQWSVNGETWYWINAAQIIPEPNGDPDPVRALQFYQKAMNGMCAYPEFWISLFEGTYDRNTKVLRVKKNA